MANTSLSKGQREIFEQAEREAQEREARRVEASQQYEREKQRSDAWRAVCYQCQSPRGDVLTKDWCIAGEQAFQKLAALLPQDQIDWLSDVETEAAAMPSALYALEMLKMALDPGTCKGAIAEALREAAESSWGTGSGGLYDGAQYVCGLFHDQERGLELDQKRETVLVIEEERPGPSSSGVAPRDKWFLEQYNARGTDTYHHPAKIHAKWGGMTATQRANICPDAPNRITKSGVEQAIKRARQRSGVRKPSKPNRRQRKRT